LKCLALNSCNVNQEYLDELEKSLIANTELRELYLYANKITPEGSRSIANIIKNK